MFVFVLFCIAGMRPNATGSSGSLALGFGIRRDCLGSLEFPRPFLWILRAMNRFVIKLKACLLLRRRLRLSLFLSLLSLQRNLCNCLYMDIYLIFIWRPTPSTWILLDMAQPWISVTVRQGWHCTSQRPREAFGGWQWGRGFGGRKHCRFG